MATITRKQSLERWDVITPDLREALFSEVNADFVAKTCENEHLPEDKSLLVAGVAGYVLLGFIHPEDLAEELVIEVGIDKRIAATIASAINQRIFTPLRSQIDSVYAPLSKFEIGPTIIQESVSSQSPSAKISTTAAGGAALSDTLKAPAVAMPKIISETFSATPTMGTSPLASNKNMAAPAPTAAKPQAKSDTDWSKQTPQPPVVKFGAITPGVPSPAKPLASIPAGVVTTGDAKQTGSVSFSPQSAATQKPTPPKTMSEFERLDMAKKMGGAMGTTPAPTTAKPAPVKPPEPAPLIIHEANSSSGQNAPGFQLNVVAHDQLAATAKPADSVSKPAFLEFSGPVNNTPNTSMPKSPFGGQPGSPMPTANSGPRQITELTANPMGTMPPVPTPPTPPGGKPKPIVKDFLGPQR